MKIFAIIKRFSSNKDQVKDNFGREVRLLSELQKRGHAITVLCADHITKERATTTLNNMKAQIYPFTILGLPEFIAAAKRMAAENDFTYATSHPLLGAVGHFASKATGKRMAYDLRDNYEAYDFTSLPLLKRGAIPKFVNSHAIRNSALITCASPAIAEIAKKKTKGAVAVITNGIDLDECKPMDTDRCRKKLGLPANAKIITYSGGIRGIGIDTLISAFKKVQATAKNAILMLIGNEIKQRYGSTADKSIIVIGQMPYKDLIYYLNASDVLAIAYEKNEFTKVMYTPYKLMDYMALNKPIVCTDIGDMKKMLGDSKLACRPGDANDMARKIVAALKTRKTNTRSMLKDFTWKNLGKKLDQAIMATFKNEETGRGPEWKN